MTKKKKLLLFIAMIAMNISFAFAQLGPLPGDPLPGDSDPDPGIEVPLDESVLMSVLGVSALSMVLFIRNKNKSKGSSQTFSKED